MEWPINNCDIFQTNTFTLKPFWAILSMLHFKRIMCKLLVDLQTVKPSLLESSALNELSSYAIEFLQVIWFHILW